MTDEPDDDDALRWQGDDDAPLAAGWKKVGTAASTRSEEPGDAATDAAPDDGADADDDAADAADADHERTDRLGSIELVALGVLGGVYLLYTIGWLARASSLSTYYAVDQSVDALGHVMFVLGTWLAVLAPAAWFATTLWLARGHRVARVAWLVVGAVLTMPVPFLFGFGVSS
ncbi:hypothetical protein [Agromyces seonyuensis]|uniref:DNA polymerase III subunit gamma/tau n=1 Tax=Agromyces seonyuensis TaxID=2662446 RepID=A0A6I4P037_9MICO|nr:hypothetical protein [Agromyces seonyuensis]MWB99910.1 hypothetical protein [Agromyces seonyuensis]